MRLLTVSALVAALVMSAATATPAVARYKSFTCVFTGGPRYTYSTPNGDWTSTTYFLDGFGTTCTYARTWVRQLAKQPYRGANKPLRHGPAGWRCLSKDIFASLHPVTAWSGVCQNRKDTRRVFSWREQSGYDERPVDPPTTP